MAGLIGLIGIIAFFMWQAFNEIQMDKEIKAAVESALEKAGK